MKKVFAVIFALVLLLSLTACQKAPVKLVSTSVNGITMDIPEDFGDFAEKEGAMVALNKDGSATICVSVAGDGGGTKPGDIDQAAYLQQSYPGKDNVEFVSYNNAADCNGIPAISAVCKMKNSNGISLTAHSFLLFYEDGTAQSVSINYSTDGDSSAKDNIDAIAKSIKLQ